MARILALDYGVKRTGIAVTDPLQLIASGLTTVETTELIPFLKKYLEEEQVEKIVIGDPKQVNGDPSQSKPYIDQLIIRLNQIFKYLAIELIDERFTSKIAFQTMIDSGISKKKRRNKSTVDQIAATIILQDYLKQQ